MEGIPCGSLVVAAASSSSRSTLRVINAGVDVDLSTASVHGESFIRTSEGEELVIHIINISSIPLKHCRYSCFPVGFHRVFLRLNY